MRIKYEKRKGTKTVPFSAINDDRAFMFAGDTIEDNVLIKYTNKSFYNCKMNRIFDVKDQDMNDPCFLLDVVLKWSYQ